MAISGRTLKRKPSFQIDANTALIANQSILSNGLGELDFDLSMVNFIVILVSQTKKRLTFYVNSKITKTFQEGVATQPEQEQSTFHDPLLDEFEQDDKTSEKEPEEENEPVAELEPTQSSQPKLIRRKSIGLGSVMADIKEPQTPKSFETDGRLKIC